MKLTFPFPYQAVFQVVRRRRAPPLGPTLLSDVRALSGWGPVGAQLGSGVALVRTGATHAHHPPSVCVLTSAPRNLTLSCRRSHALCNPSAPFTSLPRRCLCTPAAGGMARRIPSPSTVVCSAAHGPRAELVRRWKVLSCRLLGGIVPARQGQKESAAAPEARTTERHRGTRTSSARCTMSHDCNAL